MITETSAVNFRQNLGEMLNQVQYRHDSVVINKDGKPVAALVETGTFAISISLSMSPFLCANFTAKLPAVSYSAAEPTIPDVGCIFHG